jgi:hypothetical protein
MKHLLAGITASIVISFTASACLEGTVDFGPPNNLRRRGGDVEVARCQLPAGADGSVCPDWTTEVFPLFDEKYLCAENGCHLGPNDPTGVNMVKGDPTATHAALKAFTRDDGRPYISDDDPDSSYLLCNIDPNAPVIIGSIMPKGIVITPEDLITIGNWVDCGMKLSGGTPNPTGGMGGMGAGGALGTGGSGGQ